VLTTITRRRVVEKVGVGQKRVLWPLVILPLLPAAAAAISFDDDSNADTAVVETTVAAAPEPAIAATPDSSPAALAPETTSNAAPETTSNAAPETTSNAAPETTVAAATSETTPAPAVAQTVADIVAGSPDHSALAAALGAAELSSALAGPGPFTVFAPTDAAFARLPPGVAEALLRPENLSQLAKVLRYHVVSGALNEADLTGERSTIDGTTIALAAGSSGITVSDTAGTTGIVTTPGIPAANGIVYVVDSVLLPPGFVPPGQTNAAGDAIAEDLTVYFSTGSDGLDTEARAKVQRAVDILGALAPGSKVSMVGHADATGDPEANRRLSERRVNRVLAAVQAGLGERASNIEFSSEFRGSAEPAEDLAMSRRVTVEIEQG
jgi:uncharacterized surface protein with fasciclin (FAS1) repeats